MPRRRSGRYAKWQWRYQGPFTVIAHPGPVTYIVQKTDRSRPRTVHVDKMKTCYAEEDSGPTIDSDRDQSQRDGPPDTPLSPPRRSHRNTRLSTRYREEPPRNDCSEPAVVPTYRVNKPRRHGLTENDGHENDGPSKLQGMKLQHMKMTDQIAGHEIAGHENAGHENTGHENARHHELFQ